MSLSQKLNEQYNLFKLSVQYLIDKKNINIYENTNKYKCILVFIKKTKKLTKLKTMHYSTFIVNYGYPPFKLFYKNTLDLKKFMHSSKSYKYKCLGSIAQIRDLNSNIDRPYYNFFAIMTRNERVSTTLKKKHVQYNRENKEVQKT